MRKFIDSLVRYRAAEAAALEPELARRGSRIVARPGRSGSGEWRLAVE